MPIDARFQSGEILYGEDLTEAELQDWYANEEQAYFDLLEPERDYPYEKFHQFHAYRFLPGPFDCCVAIGCANGDDVRALAPKVKRFVGIEPAEQWWSDNINGTPAEFLKPHADGTIPLADQSVDLVTALGVLHHIPVVSKSLDEIARILKPGGTFIMRETISSMGDWTKPRRGGTKNERGISPKWLEKQVAKNFVVRQKRYCMFSLTFRLKKQSQAFRSYPVVLFDYLASLAFAWNAKYWRQTALDRIAPTSALYIMERR